MNEVFACHRNIEICLYTYYLTKIMYKDVLCLPFKNAAGKYETSLYPRNIR